jgi:hypothetical protein
MAQTEVHEYISDVVSPSRVTKPVTHYRESITRDNIASFDEYTDYNRYQQAGPNAHWFSWGVYGYISVSRLSTSYPKTIAELLRQAMHKFHSTNQTDNLLNIVESTQLKDGLKGTFSWLKSIEGGGLRNIVRRSKGASSAYLLYSFGIAPLINDMKKMDSGLRQFKRDMDSYIRNYRKPFTATASCRGSVVLSNTSGLSGYGPANDTGSVWHTSVHPTFVPLLTVGVRGHRNVDYNSDAWKRLDYVISRYVARGPASFAWEVIPFSFVLDWFADLSTIIDALDNAFTGFSKSIVDSWMSERYEVLMPVFKHKTGGWTSDSDGRQTALNELSYYHREYLAPSLNTGPSDRFGKKQASLLAALLHQMVANLKRR